MRISFHEFDHHHGIDGVLSIGLAPTRRRRIGRPAATTAVFLRGRKAGEPRVDDRRSASDNGTKSQGRLTK